MPESRSLLSGPGDKELYKLYIDLNLCPGASEHLFMGVKQERGPRFLCFWKIHLALMQSVDWKERKTKGDPRGSCRKPAGLWINLPYQAVSEHGDERVWRGLERNQPAELLPFVRLAVEGMEGAETRMMLRFLQNQNIFLCNSSGMYGISSSHSLDGLHTASYHLDSGALLFLCSTENNFASPSCALAVQQCHPPKKAFYVPVMLTKVKLYP